MKQPKTLTLEQTMDRVNNDIKRVHLWQIFMGILLALILISEIIFRNETSYMPITLCLLLMRLSKEMFNFHMREKIGNIFE